MRVRKDLSADGLFNFIRSEFSKVKDDRRHSSISVTDALSSAFAVFSLKFPSLLAFETRSRREEANLKKIYGIKEVPSDTQMRAIIDELSPTQIRKIFKTLFAKIQRGKGLEPFSFMDGLYLCSVDGTGYFSSSRVHCDSCLKKEHKDGSVTYYHQMLSSVIVHPERKEVIPIGAEPIVKQDGSNKNDCERNAMKRLATDLRREHPHLNILLTADGLYSNGPLIKQVTGLGMHYLFGVKKADHKFLFEHVENNTGNRVKELEIQEKDTIHRFRYVNKILLNQTHLDMSVNFIEYWQIQEGKRTLHFSWVTDIEVTSDNIMKLMRGGRARWRIENETFNTLKNQGYEFEHNFGHGYKNLSVNFALIMLLAFAVDQTQQICCALFRKAHRYRVAKTYIWADVRAAFRATHLLSYVSILEDIVQEFGPSPAFDSG